MDQTSLTRRNLTLAPLGMAPVQDASPYACTPKGARLIGAAGVDGVHYCFVRGFAETVFAVSPMNAPGEQVHPIARSFPELLRLLLACGSADALEQAWQWDEAQFDAYLRENRPGEAAQAALDAIAEAFSLTPMEAPYAYLHALQAGFDRRRIRMTGVPAPQPQTEPERPTQPAEVCAASVETASASAQADAPTAPETPETPDAPWAVYFEGGFAGAGGRTKPGEALETGCTFDWAGECWCVPAVYACGKGLVADVCRRIPADMMRAFLEKWALSPEEDGADRTADQRLQIEAENPLELEAAYTVEINGRAAPQSKAARTWWLPMYPDACGGDARAAVAHYGLDAADCWVIERVSFPWATARRPQLRTLRLTLAQQPQRLPVGRFVTDGKTADFSLRHPVTGEVVVLHVLEHTAQTMRSAAVALPGCELPAHCVQLRYTLTPPQPEGSLRLTDCAPADRPRCAAGHEESASLFSTGIAFLLPESEESGVQCACSSLRFEPAACVEWRADFFGKTRPDTAVTLL